MDAIAVEASLTHAIMFFDKQRKLPDIQSANSDPVARERLRIDGAEFEYPLLLRPTARKKTSSPMV